MANLAPASEETRPLFACDSRDFEMRDVVDAALFRGEIARLWLESLTRMKAAELGEQSDAVLADGAIDEAAVAFRYRYDLITAEETEAWLEARGLTLADFSEHFARVEWAKKQEGRAQPPDLRYEAASPSERRIFLIDLVLTGELEKLAREL